MPTDAMPLKRIDHVRFFVGNARQSAYFYRNAFGFDVVAYAGLETGVRARGRLRAPPGGDHVRAGLAARRRPSRRPAAGPARRRRPGHRPGGRRRAGGVRGRRGAGAQAGVAAAHASRTSTASTSSPRSTPTATRRTRFVEPRPVRGVFAPGYKPLDPDRYSPGTFHPVGLKAIDHIVANVEEGKMDEWVDSTARSWASRCWPASTTRTSAPSTRP